MGDRKGTNTRDSTPAGKPLLHKHKHRDSNIRTPDALDLDQNAVLYDAAAIQDADAASHHLERGRSYQNNSYAAVRHDTSPPSRAASLHSSGTPRQRPTFSRRSTLRSRSPATNARLAARKKYTYAAFFLVVSLISFCVQTELAAYVQHDLGWNKAYCMLYLTHGSWFILWPTQLLILRLQKRDMPWPVFWKKHVWLCRTTAQMVQNRSLEVPHFHEARSPVRYMLVTTALVTSALTVAGLSWYLAVDMTTPSDLTAIYNCSAFFAYAFSVPMLKEPFRLDKCFAVIIAIAGVVIVAYGDSHGETAAGAGDDGNRFLGNMIIGAGSVLYGLYEVLYKRYACPPDGCSPGRGMVFANTVGSLIGSFTLFVLWIPLPILHMTGLETFVLPTGATAWWLFLSVIMNATFAGSFLVLISLTSPVLSSVASLLSIFIVAVSDWMLTGQPLSLGAIVGGVLIIVAFVMLAVSTWREMAEEERQKEIEFDESDDAGANEDSEDEDEDEDAASDKASSHHGGRRERD